MAVGVPAWSTTAATNGAVDSNINFAENQAPSTVNDSARALMAAVKAFVLGLGGGITYGGTGNAYTATNAAPGVWASYAAGASIIALKPNATNTGAATINVDGLGVKTIKTADGGDVLAGDLVSGGLYLLAYDGTYMQVLNTIAGGSYQPLDGDLTAISALGYTSGAYLIKKTAADTYSLIALTTAGEAIVTGANAGAQRGSLGSTTVGDAVFVAANAAAAQSALSLVPGTNVQAYNANLTAINQALTTTSAPTFAAGTQVGATGGSTSAPTVSNTNLLLYKVSSTNWNGIGADLSGQIYFATTNGGTSVVTRMTIGVGAAGTVDFTTAPTIGGTPYFDQAVKQASSPTFGGLTLTGSQSIVNHTAVVSLTLDGQSGGTAPGGYFRVQANTTTKALMGLKGAIVGSASTAMVFYGPDGFQYSPDASNFYDIWHQNNSGAAGANIIGYTPANKAGDTFSGDVTSTTALRYNNGTFQSFFGSDGSRPSIGINSAHDLGVYVGGANRAIFYQTGLLGVPGGIQAPVAESAETSGSLTTASANRQVDASGGITIPASTFAAGDMIAIYAGASSRTITQGSGLTQRLHGSATTGNLTLAARGMCAVRFISATECVICGDVS